jgi:hypothetical protein
MYIYASGAYYLLPWQHHSIILPVHLKNPGRLSVSLLTCLVVVSFQRGPESVGGVEESAAGDDDDVQ